MDQLITAEDLLLKMRLGTKEVYEIKMRGLTIPVRMISLDERLDIRARMTMKNSKALGDQASLASLVQKEILMTASTLAKGESSMLSERLMSMLSLDEILFLYNEYQRITDLVNPSLEQITGDQFNALVDAVKKNNVSVSDLSLPQLRGLALAYQDLIQRLDIPTSRTDNLSGGQS